MKAEDYIKQQIDRTLTRLGISGDVDFSLEQPKQAEHGDLSTNVAMLLASTLKRNPRQIADELLRGMELDPQIVSRSAVAGAGFINFHLTDHYLRAAIRDILQEREEYGRSDWGKSRRVQFEFVSANPTGPLNVVSARAATVGDVLANVFKTVGFDVQKEYYVNDAGRQVRLLGLSVSARYMELLGRDEPFPLEGYHGDYIRDLAQEIMDEHGDKFAQEGSEERWTQFSQIAVEKIIASQQQVLDEFRVDFTNWFRESQLRERNADQDVLKILKDKGCLYEREGATWFTSNKFGDEKDRVLVTSEGEPTYFLMDIAYHLNKFQRGFEKLYDLWGPDHHGYIERMKAALVALGYQREQFEVEIIQQVNLLEKGEVVKMSKRAGKIIEMKELIEEVGVDVARYFFLSRRNQSPMDFDMDLAKNTTEENPVYYVQYAHARVCNILKFAEENGVRFEGEKANLECIKESEEFDLIKKLLEYPAVITKAARFLEPHRLPNYLQELAAAFHRFYHHHRVVTEDSQLTQARLALVESTRIVLANALHLMAIRAPERM